MPNPLERGLELLADYHRPDASVAHILCDRHPLDAVAFTVIDADLSATDLTYGDLAAASAAFATGLARLGVGPGDRVATLMGKSPEYLIALLGIWRLGAVHVPLFTAFAPPAILMRLAGSHAKVVVTDTTQRPKLDPEPGAAAPPWRIVLARHSHTPQWTSDVDFADLAATPVGADPTAAVGGDAPLVHLYTSGTTGRPKGVVVPVRALAAFQTYLEFGLDVTSDDVYWNAADPGWAYGLYFGILAPLAAGRRALVVRPPFNPATTWAVLDRYQVTNLAAAPTVYRAMRAAPAPAKVSLRRASSAGEPLTPDVNEWAPDALGTLVHDHFGQTETGMVLNNHHHPAVARPLKPGSMGQPMPGWTVGILDDERDEPVPDGTPGRLAVDLTASPLAWFAGYADDPDKTSEKFTADGRWYLTGDTGTRDEDGYFRFSSRDDDVIIMAGYRIGPFDIESVLTSHPAVAECAVIAAPDRIRGEVLEAFVVLHAGHAADTTALQQWVRDGYGAHAYPRTIHFVSTLPKTESGKVRRHTLREQRRAELATGDQ